jgi:hypothetical protein
MGASIVVEGGLEGVQPVIYCWINSGRGTDCVVAMAMAEDGTCLAQHISSSDRFARLDSGFADAPEAHVLAVEWGPNRAKRARFAEHYPDGYGVEWVDDPAHHPGLLAAYALNQQGRAA